MNYQRTLNPRLLQNSVGENRSTYMHTDAWSIDVATWLFSTGATLIEGCMWKFKSIHELEKFKFNS